MRCASYTRIGWNVIAIGGANEEHQVCESMCVLNVLTHKTRQVCIPPGVHARSGAVCFSVAPNRALIVGGDQMDHDDEHSDSDDDQEPAPLLLEVPL